VIIDGKISTKYNFTNRRIEVIVFVNRNARRQLLHDAQECSESTAFCD